MLTAPRAFALCFRCFFFKGKVRRWESWRLYRFSNEIREVTQNKHRDQVAQFVASSVGIFVRVFFCWFAKSMQPPNGAVFFFQHYPYKRGGLNIQNDAQHPKWLCFFFQLFYLVRNPCIVGVTFIYSFHPCHVFFGQEIERPGFASLEAQV